MVRNRCTSISENENRTTKKTSSSVTMSAYVMSHGDCGSSWPERRLLVNRLPSADIGDRALPDFRRGLPAAASRQLRLGQERLQLFFDYARVFPCLNGEDALHHNLHDQHFLLAAHPELVGDGQEHQVGHHRAVQRRN